MRSCSILKSGCGRVRQKIRLRGPKLLIPHDKQRGRPCWGYARVSISGCNRGNVAAYETIPVLRESHKELPLDSVFHQIPLFPHLW